MIEVFIGEVVTGGINCFCGNSIQLLLEGLLLGELAKDNVI